VGIDQFARVDPKYRNRIARHEAAHFLVGYMLGVPVAGYSLGLGKTHVDFLEAKLERKIFGPDFAISDKTLLPLACVCMAGVAAEAMAFPGDVRGQDGDLVDLQRILNKAENKARSIICETPGSSRTFTFTPVDALRVSRASVSIPPRLDAFERRH
jgi:hypothetical protein